MQKVRDMYSPHLNFQQINLFAYFIVSEFKLGSETIGQSFDVTFLPSPSVFVVVSSLVYFSLLASSIRISLKDKWTER